MPTIESLLDVAHVARLTGLSPRTIWKMLEDGRTPKPVRIGRAVRFRASDIDFWIKAGCPSRKDFECAAQEEVAP